MADIERLIKASDLWPKTFICEEPGDFRKAIEDAPTVDAVEVVHGRWVDNGIPESILSGCSVCGFSCGAHSFNYCPNCGAKMDGGNEDG